MTVYDGVNKLQGRIALVCCSGRKVRTDDIPAAQLFCGTAYISARAFALSKFDGWFILSSKYGLLHPEKRIDYYDIYLGAQNAEYRRQWASRVATAIRESITPGSSLTFLCGKHYWEDVVPLLHLDYPCELPLRHLRQGEQVKWLQAQAAGLGTTGPSIAVDAFRPPIIPYYQTGVEMDKPAVIPTTSDFNAALKAAFMAGEAKGLSYIDVTSGSLHREVGGYPGTQHRMPMCCDAMRKAMLQGDAVIASPPKGKGATLTIRYKLPRPR